MDVQLEHLDGHSAQLTVTLEADKTEASKQKAARSLAKQVRIPGFRPGKAPYRIIASTLGEEAILQQVVDELGDNLYRSALEQSQLEPGGMASLADYKEESGQLRLIFNVPKEPEIDLKDYKALRGELDPKPVTDETLKNALDSLREEKAVTERVEREARLGDEVQLNLRVTWLHKDSDEDEGHEHQIVDEPEGTVILRPADDKRDLFPGFSAQVIGLKAGDKKEFSLPLPEDFENEELAGQTVDTTLEIQEVRSRTLPELNDTFAETASNGEAPTLLELRAKMRQELEEASERIAKDNLFEEIFQQIIDQAELRFHESLVDSYTDDMLDHMDKTLRREAGVPLADYLKLTNQTEAELRAQRRDEVVARIKRDLVIGELVRTQKLSANDTDIDAEIDKAVERFGDQAGKFRRFFETPEMRLQMASDLVMTRVRDYILDIALGKLEEEKETTNE